MSGRLKEKKRPKKKNGREIGGKKRKIKEIKKSRVNNRKKLMVGTTESKTELKQKQTILEFS